MLSLATATVLASVALAPSVGADESCATLNGRGCAPLSQRVDLATPTFSNPTEITNPLFPISNLHSALLLGHVDGKPFRTETTLLPQTQVMTWRGQRVEVCLSQYVAYLDGWLEEVALDRYAQADDGSVWYFGEDVFDYRKGAIAITEGTWLAGREGPAAMIMPGRLAVGDAYRTENAPGVVFEEVTVDEVGKTVVGPLGPVAGAMVAKELHTDGSHEKKIFAPGYGEFRTSGGGDLEALALAVPKDALPGLPPPELTTLSSGSVALLESARVADWNGAASTLKHVRAAWGTLRRTEPPPAPVVVRVDRALRALTAGVGARNVGAVGPSAIKLGQSALDLELRHRPPVEIDAARFELWTQQLRVDAAAHDLAAVTGDAAVLEWIRDRFAAALDADERAEVSSQLRDLRVATDTKNLPAAADHAARLGARLRNLVMSQPVS
jgi:hypothetical protein